METSVASKHQVVPQRDRNVEEDESVTITQIALSLQNPSPCFPKNFDFSRSNSFANGAMPSGLFSPNFTELLMNNGTPNIQTSNISPFALSASRSTFLGSENNTHSAPPATTTPVSHEGAELTMPDQASPASSSPNRVPVSEPRRKRTKSESDDSDDYQEEEESHESDEEELAGSDEESDASYQKETAKRRKRKAPQAVTSNARTFHDLTDDDIAFMDFKELTRMMTQAGLNRQAIADVKARRRRLKNRQSARLCSNKKRELCQELATEKSKLQDQMSSLQQAFNKLQREHNALKQQYDALLRQTR